MPTGMRFVVGSAMKNILVWDIPTRIFHWAFAVSLSAALGIGFLADDDHPLFRLHMLFGIVALFLLLLRVVWGIAGSRHARFSGYPLRPHELADYLLAAVFSKTKRYAGNNPGSALAAVLMFLLVPALVISGSGLAGGEVGEIHETLAWILMLVVSLHLAGIIWHTIRHKENIAASMITGRKEGNPADAISTSHPWLGLLVLLLGGVWVAALFQNQDPRSKKIRLPVLGVSIPVGEAESEMHEPTGGNRHVNHDDDD